MGRNRGHPNATRPSGASDRPDSLLDAEGRPDLAAHTEPHRQEIALPHRRQPVFPDMTVQATVHTGSQTLLANVAGQIPCDPTDPALFFKA